MNGPYSVSPSGIYKVAGTILTYQRGDKYRMECVIAAGPLNESISLEILYHEINPGVLYKYMLPTNDLDNNNYDISPPLYTTGKLFIIIIQMYFLFNCVIFRKKYKLYF